MKHNIAPDGRYLFGKVVKKRYVSPCYRNDGPTFIAPSGYETYETLCVYECTTNPRDENGQIRTMNLRGKVTIMANGKVSLYGNFV